MWLHVILNCVILFWVLQVDNAENATTKSSTLKSEKIIIIGEMTADAECGKLVSLEDNKENKKYVGEDVSVKVNFIAHLNRLSKSRTYVWLILNHQKNIYLGRRDF